MDGGNDAQVSLAVLRILILRKSDLLGKMLKINAHLQGRLPTFPRGVEVFGCQIAMRVRTLIPTLSQEEKGNRGTAGRRDKKHVSP